MKCMHGDEAEYERAWIDPDELEVLRSLVACGVRFLIVGGRAVQFHGHWRPAKDLDLLVDFEPDNWENLRAALRPLHASVLPFDMLSKERRYQARLNFYPTVELLTSIRSVTFDQAWVRSAETSLDGIQVRVLSKLDLVESKQGTSRRLDADDVRDLLNS